MNMEQWRKRLVENFTTKGAVGGNLFEVLDLEKACQAYFFQTFHGQAVLSESFQSFFVETLKTALKWLADNGWPTGCPGYDAIYVYYLVMLRRFWACETLLRRGYPLDGYALLRGLKDQAILLAGIVRNLTTLTSIFGDKGVRVFPEHESGVREFTEDDYKEIIKLRYGEEKRVRDLLLGKKSGLPEEIVKNLRMWGGMFNEEVHGSRFSFTVELSEWRRGKRAPSIGPIPRRTSWGNYMNRANEICWLIVRLLPYLQPVENAFGQDWQRKSEILDDSFRYAEQELSNLGKQIGGAFIKFVDEKFSFRKPLYYFEADGSG